MQGPSVQASGSEIQKQTKCGPQPQNVNNIAETNMQIATV